MRVLGPKVNRPGGRNLLDKKGGVSPLTAWRFFMLKLLTRLRVALFFVPFALAAASCGGSGNSDIGSGGPGGGGCTVGGHACQNACSATLGCVECASNADCGGGRPICVRGSCEECSATADCGTGQACYTRDFSCHPACSSNADCNDPGQDLCDTKTGACVGCLTNTDCGGGRPICDGTTGQCVSCLSNKDCGVAEPVCNPREGACVQCLVDRDCGAGARCNNDHHCHPYCASNADCDSAHPFCDTHTGDCRECLANTDCPTAQPFCTNDGHCTECLMNSDCTDAALPACWHQDHCAECAENSDCPNNGHCHGGTCG